MDMTTKNVGLISIVSNDWDMYHTLIKFIFQPKMVTIDPNDDNIILGIPEDIDPATLPQEGPIKKVKIIQKHVKQSRMMLNRSGKF